MQHKPEMSELTQHERYLKGLPLSEALAELAHGEEEPDDAIVEVVPGELSDVDREHLRRLKFEPGWTILVRIVDESIDREEEDVKRQSIIDPLKNKEAIANGWAYIAMLRRARSKFVNKLDDEIGKLRGQL